jgi:hypothetical protein
MVSAAAALCIVYECDCILLIDSKFTHIAGSSVHDLVLLLTHVLAADSANRLSSMFTQSQHICSNADSTEYHLYLTIFHVMQVAVGAVFGASFAAVWYYWLNAPAAAAITAVIGKEIPLSVAVATCIIGGVGVSREGRALVKYLITAPTRRSD